MRSLGARSLGRPSEELETLLERAREVADERDFLEQVGDLVQASGELLTPEVAALTVLDEMDETPEAELVAPSYATVLPPEDLEPGLDGVIVEGELLGIEPTRTFQRDDGSTGFVTDARVRGEEGIYEITLWDENIQALVGVEAGTRVRLDGLYTKEHRDEVELHTGRDARIRVGDEVEA